MISYVALTTSLTAQESAQQKPSSTARDARAQSQSEQSVSLPRMEVRRAKPQPRRRATVARTAPSSAVPRPVVQAERGTGPVTGYTANQSVTATKTDTPILQTPQSISVVPRAQIEAQQAQSLPEAVRYTPSVSTELYGANSLSDEIKVRGFVAPRYLDGLRLPYDTVLQFAQTKTEPYGLERLEILRGPSSGVYGQAAPGGIVSMISKRPTANQVKEVEFQTGSFNRLQGAFDLGGAFDKSNELLYRFNGVFRDTDKVVDFYHENYAYLAPSFAWAPTKDTKFTILTSFLRDHGDGQPQQYVPAFGTLLPNVNGRIPYSRNIGEPNYDKYKIDQALIGYAFEHRINEVLQFRQNTRYGDVTIDMNSMRNESAYPNNTVLARTANFIGAHARTFTVDNQFQADFNTGPLTHKALVGVDYYNGDIMGDYRFAFGFPINAYAPAYGQTIPGAGSLTPFIQTSARQEQLGVYVQDQIKFDRWMLTLTGRHDNATATTTNHINNTNATQDNEAWTYRIALTYLFDFGLAPYVSYSTSFDPVVGFSVVDAQGRPFKPTTGQGSEVGVKYQPPGTNLLFTGALFETTQRNVLTTDPSNPTLSVQAGEVRVRGAEFEARGNITRQLEIIAGASHIEPIITNDTTAVNVGKDMAVVPRDLASLWAMYTMRDGPLAGVGFGGGVRYVGALFGDSANTIRIPSHTLFDAAMTFDFAYWRPDMKGLKLQVNATNLFDKYYVANCYTGFPYCALGAPRTVLATLKYQWQ